MIFSFFEDDKSHLMGFIFRSFKLESYKLKTMMTSYLILYMFIDYQRHSAWLAIQVLTIDNY